MSETRRRDGELVQESDDIPWHDPRCDTGWLSFTVDERPEPCPVCRPHVARAQTDHRRRALQPHRRASPAAQEAAMAIIRAELARARHERTGAST